jgi:hypothetical protein
MRYGNRVTAEAESQTGLLEERRIDFVPSRLFQMASHLIRGR